MAEKRTDETASAAAERYEHQPSESLTREEQLEYQRNMHAANSQMWEEVANEYKAERDLLLLQRDELLGWCEGSQKGEDELYQLAAARSDLEATLLHGAARRVLAEVAHRIRADQEKRGG